MQSVCGWRPEARSTESPANPVAGGPGFVSRQQPPTTYGGAQGRKSDHEDQDHLCRGCRARARLLRHGCVGCRRPARTTRTPTPTTIPGPDATTPSDPAADDNPAARVPTTEDESGYRVQGKAPAAAHPARVRPIVRCRKTDRANFDSDALTRRAPGQAPFLFAAYLSSSRRAASSGPIEPLRT